MRRAGAIEGKNRGWSRGEEWKGEGRDCAGGRRWIKRDKRIQVRSRMSMEFSGAVTNFLFSSV